ncbi:Di-/tricarboxylate transporter [uncultured delta proteobacterium]|uniref:Di-/tricarboxylate transporter n=1 Tax=uncultured delta proteobacterium TaxID=34034 RepID=A0A212IVY6_9DELT|nr:Di-/tricarboxylate transporter [uncultured delta proteobacterium]
MAQDSAAQPSRDGTPGKNLWYYTASAIGLLIVFGFGSLPPIAPITPMGMKVLGIFLGMIFLWSFVSILWPSLLGIVALAICGYAPLPKILWISFGDTVPTLVLFAMVLFGAIQHAGVTRYISRWFLTRKIINGKPVVFSFVFIYATYVLAALSANILPALLFMWAILYGVLDDVGYKKGDKYTAIMVIGTMFGAISGQAAKPFTGSALMIVGAYEKAAQTQLDYFHYMLFGVIMSSLGILLYALLIKFVLKPDMSKIQDITIERFDREKLPNMDLRQKILMASLFGYLIMVLLPSILPKSLVGVAFLAKLGPLGMVILFVVGLSLFKYDDKPIIDFKEIAGRYIIWDVYFLVCMAMAISTALTAGETGIVGFLQWSLDPILGGHSFFMFSIILVLFGMGITQLANNAVMGVLLMPVIKAFSEQAGANFEAVAVMITFAMHIALLTPAASPYAAILYGNRNWISQNEVFKYGLILFVMSAALFVFVGIPCMNLIY